MTSSRLASTALRGSAILLAWVIAADGPAPAQQPPPSPPQARIIVTGEGSVTVPPDYAELASGVTTKGATAEAATAANSKVMEAVNAALRNAGVAANDVQTSQFSVQPLYGPAQPNSAPKLLGFSVANELRVKIRQIAKVGAVLDTLIAAGATDVGGVQFLHSDTEKVLDQARQAAIADARRKAELYAQSSGLSLGAVSWISELPPYAPITANGGPRAFSAARAVPISQGEDTLRVEITVGFDVAH